MDISKESPMFVSYKQCCYESGNNLIYCRIFRSCRYSRLGIRMNKANMNPAHEKVSDSPCRISHRWVQHNDMLSWLKKFGSQKISFIMESYFLQKPPLSDLIAAIPYNYVYTNTFAHFILSSIRVRFFIHLYLIPTFGL
jgi:hypothetical protein